VNKAQKRNLKAWLLSWLGVIGAAINIFGHLEAFLSLADWVRLAISKWTYWFQTLWSALFSVFGVKLSISLVMPLTTSLFLLLMWIGSRMAPSATPLRTDEFTSGAKKIILALGAVACVIAAYGAHTLLNPPEYFKLLLEQLAPMILVSALAFVCFRHRTGPGLWYRLLDADVIRAVLLGIFGCVFAAIILGASPAVLGRYQTDNEAYAGLALILGPIWLWVSRGSDALVFRAILVALTVCFLLIMNELSKLGMTSELLIPPKP
jgi:hypothetical protein